MMGSIAFPIYPIYEFSSSIFSVLLDESIAVGKIEFSPGPNDASAHRIIEIQKMIFPASTTNILTFSKTVIPKFLIIGF